MIKIEQHKSDNLIYLTLCERMNDISNDVLIIFEDETNPEDRYAIILDYNISNIKPRIDIYEIKEDTGIPNHSIGEINLPHSGFYIYNVYEILDVHIDFNQDYDLNDTDLFKWLEKGRCKVIGDEQILNPITNSNEPLDDVYL